MPKDDFVIRIGGDTAIGGVISTGENFTFAASRLGFHTFTFRTYPAEIRGGHAWFQVRISNQPVFSLGDGCDILIAFDHAPGRSTQCRFAPRQRQLPRAGLRWGA